MTMREKVSMFLLYEIHMDVIRLFKLKRENLNVLLEICGRCERPSMLFFGDIIEIEHD